MAEGEGGTPPLGSGATDWHASIPDTFTYQDNGTAKPLREHPAIKDTPDVGTLAKRFLDTQSEMGRRIPVLPKDAKPEQLAEWRKNHLPKLVEAQLIPGMPPEAPDKYTLNKPEKLPEGLQWNDDWTTKAAQTFHKLGLTNDQAVALMGLHQEIMGEMAPQLKLSYEDGINKLKTDWGADFEKNSEMAGRFAAYLYNDDPDMKAFIDSTGLGNHPKFLKAAAMAGKLLEEDDGFIQGGGQAQVIANPEAEVKEIMNNPQHPMHERWLKRDKQVLEHVSNLWKQSTGGK